MKKILFLDRDGTLINEPADFQVDTIAKFSLIPGVIPALLQLSKAGYQLVMISNQDGLGTDAFPEEQFNLCQNLLLNIFKSQGIEFIDILICPHFEAEKCACRKPKTGLLTDYIIQRKFDLTHSYVIGDRLTDQELAQRMGIASFLIASDETPDWASIVQKILFANRVADIHRQTKETNIHALINLDIAEPISIKTGLGFLDHMLEQLAKHGGFSLQLEAEGDLHIDAHHLIEDCAIVLGQAFNKALGDKYGLSRYGFLLPMDEALAEIALDFSGRNYFQFQGNFPREAVGQFPTELVAHFFRSFCENIPATLNMKIQGEDTHHMVEALFKGLGRTLRQAFQRLDFSIPSTKGLL